MLLGRLQANGPDRVCAEASDPRDGRVRGIRRRERLRGPSVESQQYDSFPQLADLVALLLVPLDQLGLLAKRTT